MAGAARTVSLGRRQLRSARTCRTQGGATVSTAQSQYGGASLLCTTAPAGYVTVDCTSVFAPGSSGDFTIEMWGRLATTVNDKYWFDGRPDVESVTILMDGASLKVYANGNYRITATDTVSADTWYHVAYTRSGTTGTLWLDGVSQGTWTDTVNYTFSNPVYIGSRDTGAGSAANFDEIRISTTARYTTGFTPSGPFVNDADTVLLMHCNGLDGTTVFRDDNLA